MSNKEIIDKVIKKITSNSNNWCEFLYCACCNYKLPIHESLLTYYYKPTAKAILPSNIWLKKFGRELSNNPTEIPINQSKKYFDVTDTVETSNSINVPIWEYKDTDKALLVNELRDNYNVDYFSFNSNKNYSDDVVFNIRLATANLLNEYTKNNHLKLKDNEKSLIEISIAYMSIQRCSIKNSPFLINTLDFEYYRRELSNNFNEILPIINILSKDLLNVISNTVKENHKKIENEVVIAEREKVETNKIEKITENYILNNNDIGIGTPKERYKNNIEAIKLLKICNEEKRNATEEEKTILTNYVGWGGLADVFDKNKPKWHSEYGELKDLLSEEQYNLARESTLTAFYTPPIVINSIYEVLNNLKFKQGEILEPSCGIGNFIGCCPNKIAESKFTAVELDSISGNIAKLLYPKTNVKVDGYENISFPNNKFDVAIGNVPFGQFSVVDNNYKNNYLIHDYFFIKTLDVVRPGGVIAFITSQGTLDKSNSKIREYIGERANFLGAIRLPNNTFTGSAGTTVTSDVIFLQKKEKMEVEDSSFIHIGVNDDNIEMNQYFVEHPEMIIGKMEMVTSQYGMKSTCSPIEKLDLEKELNKAILNIKGEIKEFDKEKDLDEESISNIEIPNNVEIQFNSYFIYDDDVYIKYDRDKYDKIDTNQENYNRYLEFIKLRDCHHSLLNCEVNNGLKEEADVLRTELNTIYDSFVEKYGYLDNKTNEKLFRNDDGYYAICGLELISNKKHIGKADIFFKSTIRPIVNIKSTDSAMDALAVCLSEKAKIDINYIAKLSNKSIAEIEKELGTNIFRVPIIGENEQYKYVTADEYLSGNIRKKLNIAKSFANQDEHYMVNVKELEKVLPNPLSASEIDVRLGATWISVDYYNQFMYSIFETSIYNRYDIKVNYSNYTNEYQISNKAKGNNDTKASNTYGTFRISGYKILENSLNLQDVKIYDTYEDTNGKKKRVLNGKETQIASAKQDEIKEKFKEWIWNDSERRRNLCKLYNDKFNSIRPRKYNGENLEFPGMNLNISLLEHQKNAIARMLYGNNTLLAHVVGAGKTFSMVAAAQESKRLGLCHKSMFIVPNHLTDQWAKEYLILYPNANILVTTKKDFQKNNRKKFCSRIVNGNYDAVIMGQSQFEKIPMSYEYKEEFISNQINEITHHLEKYKKELGKSFTVKQMEKTKKSLNKQLKKLHDETRKDSVVTFEELGVDKLFVDEAHYYKNLFFSSKMRNVAGISATSAQKSSDLFMKCRYLDMKTEGKGVVFATGTPISNSMTEMYTLQRYLQYQDLKKLGIQHFDSWASTFGETKMSIELSPEGTGYQAKTRFAKFYNLPELMNVFSEVADIQTQDTIKLDVPNAHFHTIKTAPSEEQVLMVQGLAERADKVRNGAVNPHEDNMLKITNDGRKLALDQRLINELLEDNVQSKVNTCIDNIYNIYKENDSKKLAQLVFCDLSTPKFDGSFNVYEDIKEKLILKGITEDKIEFIHNAKTEKDKASLFEKVRKGEVRVLLGSTQKMGAGTNCQDKLIAIHDLDCPWRPSDLEQRAGRIIRQGNTNSDVHIYRYITEKTFDAYLFQILEQKQRFISQIMTNKSALRSADDVDKVTLNYAEVKMLATGNPLIKEKMELDSDVEKLRLLKSNFQNSKFELQDKIDKKYPKLINRYKNNILNWNEDLEYLKNYPIDSYKNKFPGITLENKFYDNKEEAGEILIKLSRKSKTDEIKIGEYRGFEVLAYLSPIGLNYIVSLKKNMRYRFELSKDKFGNFTKMNNCLSKIEEYILKEEHELQNVNKQIIIAKEEVEKNFDKEEEMQNEIARLAEVNVELKIFDNKENSKLDYSDILNERAIDNCLYLNDECFKGIDKSKIITYEMSNEINNFSKVLSECSSLKKVNISNNVKIIPFQAFCNCRKLKEVTLPEGIKVISNEAFKDCINLKRIKLPNSISQICNDAFKNCNDLEIRCTKKVKYIFDRCVNNNNLLFNIIGYEKNYEGDIEI